jgi:DNA-binding NtrC family response regulator
MTHKILLVDDDKENLVANKSLLSAAGYQVAVASSGEEAIRAIRFAKKDFSLVLMDYHMPGLTGTEAFAEIKKLKPNQQVVAFSMDDSREVMRANFKAGMLDFLDKNADNEVLLSAVSSYCAKYDQLYRTLDEGDAEPSEKERIILDSGMIGCSESLFHLAKQIQKVGPTNATTLILGESGTGKELVAKALRKASERSNAPFIAINIAAEPATLLDSTLFGHKKGAFTGAVNDQQGKFQQANKGTIFLDEIGDMPLDLQVKLLRVLQEREVTPIGATRPIPIDVRIVAATHRDLRQMVEQGKFREDLYYRLATVILQTAPLREHPEDIESLVVHFTRQICSENKFERTFHRRCLEKFRNYPWKGNVRELRAVVESHLINCEKDIVREEDLDAKFFQNTEESAQPKTLEEIDAHLEGIKKQMVSETLKKSSTQAEAARKLEIPPNRLHYFMTKWGLTQ